ncbi:MAG TPA: 50S ribosomal protein L23 [Acidimicrobiales bacterium]|nr:50S ribosomal protein L23 [Acidimicrobiales bacterium]
MRDPRQVILKPVVSEKSYALLEANQYTFFVHPDATKPEIHDAVESIFDVTVLRVNTLNRAGKKVRNRRTGKIGTRAATKRAIVTLSEGDSIPLFEN